MINILSHTLLLFVCIFNPSYSARPDEPCHLSNGQCSDSQTEVLTAIQADKQNIRKVIHHYLLLAGLVRVYTK